jgi:CheY-like chemotaxis protein
MPAGTPEVALVVEDEWMLRAAIVEELRGAGWEVVQTGTAEDAIAYAQAGYRVDVVVTDIRLAGRLTGWDVAEQVRRVRADVPIIYTSGSAADPSRPVAGSLFFAKPYNLGEVIAACERAGERAHLA